MNNSFILKKLYQQESKFKRELAKTFLEYLDALPTNKRIEQFETILYEANRNLLTLDRRLTSQEKKCLLLASKGKEIKEMARILGLSQRTIKYHRVNIIKKLEVPNITAAAASGILCNMDNYIDKCVNYETTKNLQMFHKSYLKIISYMPNNVYWLDRNCITQGCNNNILKLLNLKKIEEFVGINYSQMGELAGWTEGQAQSFEKDDKEVMETGIGKYNVEEPPLYNKEGEPVYYISSRVPIFDDKGKEVIGVVGISVDITERKKYEQKLKVEKQRSEAANHAKTEFLANMRHEIRTPLSGIVSCAQIIQSQANNAKKVSEFAEDLIQSSDALLEFLNKVLESIKVTNGEIPLLKKKFDLHQALKLVIQLNQAKAAQKGLLLSLNYDKAIPAYVIGDPIRVQCIILELVTNALKFTQKGEVKLTVKLMKQEARQLVVKMVVSDTGIGIPVEKQQDLYTRFKSFVPSYEGIYSAVGLGLPIIKQFLDDLQAEIYLESQSKQGSSFTCLIPFQEPLLMDSFGT